MSFDYHDAVIAVCRSIPGRIWEKDDKVWTIPTSQEGLLALQLRKLELDKPVHLQRTPSWVTQLHSSSAAQHDSDATVARLFSRLPSARGRRFSLARDLKDVQQAGVRAILARRGRTLLADEMGLGKTAQAIAAAVLYSSEWPCLVVSPSAMRTTWENELSDWLPPGLCDIHVMRTSKDVPPKEFGASLIVVTTYDMVSSLPTSLQFGVVIADEAHMIKNGESLRAKALLPRLVAANRALLLTGTPVLQRPAELYTLLCALLPRGCTPHFAQYAWRYCAPKPSTLPGLQWDYSGSSCLNELSALLLATVLVRRRKADHCSLPEKHRETVPLRLTAAALKPVQAVQAKVAACASKAEQRALSAEMYSVTGRAKIEAASLHVAALLAACPDECVSFVRVAEPGRCFGAWTVRN